MTSNNHPLLDNPHHNHVKPSSVLRSFMHKRMPSDGVLLSSTSTKDPLSNLPQHDASRPASFLPHDHPHRPLGELHQNQRTQPSTSPKKSREEKRPSGSGDKPKSLHKKTLSSISLKSLAGKDADHASKSKDKEAKANKIKKTANFSNLLSRPKSSKSLRKEAAEQEAHSQKDKENQSPARESRDDESSRPPPIYAQFSSQHFAKQPLGGKFLEDEIDLYTPQEYSPSKQRNFYEGPDRVPTLGRHDGGSQRPKSTYLPSSFSIQDISRRISGGSPRHSSDLTRKVSGASRPSFERKTTSTSATSEKTGTSRSHRVFAAVSAFGSKPKVQVAEPEPVLQDKDVDREFEAMLDRRNIPEHQRGKMRNLSMLMKRDFVKQDWAETATAKNGRPGTNGSDSSADATAATQGAPEAKSKRPRSRTFTLSRGSSKDVSSPTKKQKPQGTFGRHSRTNSSDSVNGGTKSLTTSGATVAQTLIAKAKGQLPDDFVSYLRKVQKPELVEVGRLHKLRILLRNETVAWTDAFIGQGGMGEIVALLHRTMEVEWREEHEDALLHEVLLCLKALSTTALALQQLDKIQTTLFPALLHMIFDEEKKGPSEFTTRNIITSLLFTYLKSAPLSERAHRARTLLSYLKDPEPSESQRPVGFVLEMRRSRPYQVWCKEVVNVTKEVFWIFLHNLNVIALPSSTPSNDSSPNSHDTSSSTITSSTSNRSFDASNPHHVHMARHFPAEQPPVPAAPYVGGVEWDATNYLASHLDLINGILASLPTRDERNALRDQLRVSGWEKSMGGTLRLCKEKFYGCVHAALRCWVAAATEDGWVTRDVRCGPSVESQNPVRKSPRKAVGVEGAPRIEMPLDFGREERKVVDGDDAWL